MGNENEEYQIIFNGQVWDVASHYIDEEAIFSDEFPVASLALYCVIPFNEFHYGDKQIPKYIPDIKKVIFNGPATIVYWKDRTKTVVKCKGEKYDPEKGLAMAITKKALGNKYDYYEVIRKWVGDDILFPEGNKDKKKDKKKSSKK